MSDAIEVSGGGRVAVDTAVMAHAATLLAAAEHELDQVAHVLAGVVGDLPRAHLDPVVQVPTRLRCEEATDVAASAAASAAHAAAGLRIAATRYGATEEALTAGGTALAAGAGALWGSALRMSLILGPVGPVIVLGATGAVAADALVVAMLSELIVQHRVDPQLDPVVLGAVRLAIGSADDALRGFAGLETPADLLHDRPDAPFGAESIAGALAVAVAALGGVQPGVRVRRVTEVPMPPPESLGELADRVPDAHPGAAQVRIERYPDGAGSRYIVYITGTATFAPDSGGEPFDMVSNLDAMADQPAASETATLKAMRSAGVTRNDPVLLVGHSQGALVATRIAEHGGYRVAGVVTLGGPTGQVPLGHVPVLAVEHAEDPVPELGGIGAAGAAGRARTVITRRLYDGATVPESWEAVPSHSLPAYSYSLHLAERSSDPRVVAFRRRIAPFVSGPAGTASDWRADRRAPVTPARRADAAPAR